MADFSAAALGSVPQRRSLLQRVQRWLRPGAAPQARPLVSLRPNGAEPYVGEIALYPYNFAPLGWLPCDGRTLAISEYEVLFYVIGTTYGGDGISTFNLPDMRGRVAVHPGQGPGLATTYALGNKGGVETVTLTTAQLPSHTHTVGASTLPGTGSAPQGLVPADSGTGSAQYTQATAGLVTPPALPMSSVGSGAAHSNIQPYLAVPYCIATDGLYPQ
ncbi:phage tail protein [Hymenobacter lucidus]|uniref:Tail fiber protein n=1 Tax=Hymenobacter lucidus TaxID=2880930 RepID=A0ABS8AX53_9BACT|nr:tail fiber protein [Hymenobacter lucidus]MCB2410358.1 tail fiber protein [Hymenobacter lucidus]